MPFHFMIHRKDRKYVFVDEDTHRLIKAVAKKKGTTMRIVTRDLIHAGIMADDEISGHFRKKLKRYKMN